MNENSHSELQQIGTTVSRDLFLKFLSQRFFQSTEQRLLGPLATALTITSTFTPAATFLALAAGNLSAKEGVKTNNCAVLNDNVLKVFEFLLSFLPGSFASSSMP